MQMALIVLGNSYSDSNCKDEKMNIYFQAIF